MRRLEELVICESIILVPEFYIYYGLGHVREKKKSDPISSIMYYTLKDVTFCILVDPVKLLIVACTGKLAALTIT